MKKLSIITICYNEPNLEKTCQSVVNQTWQDFEWIVVDGGSNDETQKIWDKYKHRIDKFVSEPDNGIYDAMNKGINLANGKFLNFLNAGDYYFYNDVLKDVFENKTYSSEVLYGNVCILRRDIFSNYIMCMPENLTKEFLYFSTLGHQATFISKVLFEKYGLYDDKLAIASDYKKWLEFLNNKVKFQYLPYTIINFNLEGISCSEKTRHISYKERIKIIKEKFSKTEIREIKNKYKYMRKTQYSFLENIFSLKNSINKTHKIITILGVHIKIRRKNK